LRHNRITPTNHRNGEYGQHTVHDVKAFQRVRGIKRTGDVGLQTFVALWDRYQMFPAGAFDPYGVSLIMRAKVGTPTRLDPKLKAGATGPHVKAFQRMLFRALGGDSQNARNGQWGQRTTNDYALFLRRADWRDKHPRDVDAQAWAALWGFADARARELARKQLTTPSDAIRQHIRSWGEWFVANRGSIVYQQVRPYPRTPRLPIYTDCSGSACAVLRWSGCPNDPNGRNWDGQGYTGTLYNRGTRVPLTAVLPGDMVFYGNQGGGVPSHVILVIGPGDRALNFGGWPPEFVYVSSYWRSNLRTDLGAHRYF
jgi:hypothetical protein